MKQIVSQRKDIVFFLKMYPVVQLHPGAYDKSKAIVCEKDNQKALKLLEEVYAKRDIPKARCVTDAVKKNIEMAEKYGITGTPTLIFDDGARHNGSLSAPELIKLIEAH